MAERNPLGADASLSGGLTSPATSASLSGPWAFLVQNAETGVRQQLRVDADAGEWRKDSTFPKLREREWRGEEEEGASLDSSATPPPADLVAWPTRADSFSSRRHCLRRSVWSLRTSSTF